MNYGNLLSNGPIIFSNVTQVIEESIARVKQETFDEMYEIRDMAIDYYSFNNTSQYINQYFEGSLQSEMPLYTTNMTKRLINRMSLVYKDAPIREIESDVYQDYLMDKDTQFKLYERVHNLLGTMAVQVYWHEPHKHLHYRPILNFQPVFDADNPTKPIAIVYLANKTTGNTFQNQADEFIYWSDEDHFRFDSDGKIIEINEGNVNPYGVMPFCFLQPNTLIDEFWNDGALDIAYANQQVDIAMTMLQHHIRSAGGQFVIEGNVDARNIRLGLNRIVSLSDADMKNISPNVNIEAIMEGVKFQLQNVAQNHHLTFDFGLSGSKSGVALKMENLELLEAREDDVEKFRTFENHIYNIERAIVEVEDNTILPEQMSVDFAEIHFPDEKHEMDKWDWKFAHGLADQADYLMYKDPDRFPDREDALDYLFERSKPDLDDEEPEENTGNGLLRALQTPMR